MDQSEGLALASLSDILKSLVFHIVPHLVFRHWSYLKWVILIPFATRALCVYCGSVLNGTFLYIFDLHACRHVCVTLDHCVPWSRHSHTHTWAWLRLVLTQRDQSPVGEPWVWAPSSWQQEAKNLITGWLLNYREQRRLFLQRSQIGGKWVITGSEIDSMITALQSFK